MTETKLSVQFIPDAWRRELDLFLAERVPGMNAYMLTRTRLASIARLQALSEAELCAVGLDRRDIPAFVMEDILPG